MTEEESAAAEFERRLSPYDFYHRYEMDPLFPSSGWQAKDIMMALNSHDQGNFANSELLYHAMTKEPRIGSALEQRIQLRKNFDRTIQIPKDAPPRMKQMALLFDQNYAEMVPEHAETEIMRRTIMFGFCICRQYMIVKDGMILPVIEPWTHSSCWWNIYDRNFYVTTREGDVVPVVGDPWIIFTVGGSRPWLNGAIRKLALSFFLLDHAFDRWMSFNDTEAAAIRVVHMPVMTREQIEGGAAVKAAAALRAGDTYAEPEGYEFKLVTAEGRGGAYKAFQDLIQIAHNEVSITLLWNNLTQEIKGGSLAAATQADVYQLRAAKSDVEIFGNPLYETSCRIWVEKNFTPSLYGETTLTQYRPKFTWHVNIKADQKEIAESAQKYAAAMKDFFFSYSQFGTQSPLAIDWNEVAKRCGIPLLSNELPEVANYE